MEENTYLIPANANKSKLILGLFRPIDLGVFGAGAIVTFILMMAGITKDLVQVIITLLPVGICGLLVTPVPNYHNIMVIIGNIYTFFTGTNQYYWRGWCVSDKDDFE